MKDIIKKNPVSNPTFGTDPSNPWATKYNVTEATETELLARYLNSRGVNPRFVTRDTKIAHAKSSEYAKWKADHIERFAREEVEVKEDHVAIAMGKQLDDEGSMILNQLDQIARSVEMLRPVIKKPDMQVPAWVQSKVTLATDYIDTVANYMTSNNEKVNEAKKPTALEKFRKASAEREKKHAEIEKKQSKDGSGMTAAIDRLEKHLNKEESEQIDEKNVPTSPEKWARAKAAAKSKFAVYPSAYANGWASKKYKAMGGGWKSVSEETEEVDQIEEKHMTDDDMTKREKIVKSMKKGFAGFKQRYGKDAKSVMYATATKQAMKEDLPKMSNEATIAGTSGWKKMPATVTDKSGAKHSPMSRAKDLAQQAFKKVQDKTKIKSEMMLGKDGGTSESKK